MGLEGFPRGVEGQPETPPNAKWAPPEHVAEHSGWQYKAGRFFLGEANGKPIGIDDNRAVTLVAGNRSGKGVAILVPNLICWRGSVLAIDPKGENARLTARFRAETLGQRVAVLDPFGTTKGKKAHNYLSSFNPLSMLSADSPDLIEDAALIADALVISSGSGNDSHWDESAQTFIKTLSLFVALDPAWTDRRDLVSVREIINTGDFVRKSEKRANADDDNAADEEERTSIEGMLRSASDRVKGEAGELIEAGAADFFDRAPRERLTVLSTVRRHTRWLDGQRMHQALADGDWSLADLKIDKRGLSVFLCLPAGRLATHDRWLRLFVNLALEAIERTGTDDPATGHAVLMALDEFPALGYMKQIETAAGQLAGFGVKMFTVVQDFGQLHALYRDRWESFVGNSGVVIAFGNTDNFTLKYLSERLGGTTIMTPRQSEVTSAQFSQGVRGASEQPEHHPLMSPAEIALHFGRSEQRALIIKSDANPVALDRIEYFKHPAFEGKFDND